MKEIYTLLHGNYDEALQRLMNDALIKRFILKFPNDPSMDELRKAVGAGDCQAAFKAVHTLKGVSANLAFTELAQNASALTEQLRAGATSIDMALYQKVEESYELVVKTIKGIE